MSNLTCLSSTLYIPLQGRVYADMIYPEFFSDLSAYQAWMKIDDKIKAEIVLGQTEYTLLASAVRSKNMDFIIQKFLKRHEDAVIVNVGCGFEDLYSRNDNGKALWFNLDLPEVLDERRKYFPSKEREYELPFSMFDYKWIEEVKKQSNKPVLLVVSGVFHYFTRTKVLSFINHMRNFEDARIVFDTVSEQGLKISQKYVDDLGKADAGMKFGFNSLNDFVSELNFVPRSYKQARYYSYVRKFKGFPREMMARFSFSDKMNMVKMIYIRI